MTSSISTATPGIEAIFTRLYPVWREMQKITDGEKGRQFPAEEFELLREHGVLTLPLPESEGGLGLGWQVGTWPAVLRLLRCVGYVSLPVARLLEGHVNGVLLLQQFGNPEQMGAFAAKVREKGAVTGVWNTDDHTRPVKLAKLGSGEFALQGTKMFASGAGWIEAPVLTAEWNGYGRQMVQLADGDLIDGIDRSSWDPMGMRESASYTVSFGDLSIDEDALIGQPGDYYREPLFSAGGLRCVAAQFGASERVMAEVRAFLVKQNRQGNESQLARVAEIAILIESGRLWIDAVGAQADLLFTLEASAADQQKLIVQVNMARTVVERVCQRVMDLAERCVGARGLLDPYPFSRIFADLRMYLRQPFPDAALLSVGRALCEGGFPRTDPF